MLHVLGNASPTGVSLHKNKEQVLLAYSLQRGTNDSPSNGASLLLEEGDVVYANSCGLELQCMIIRITTIFSLATCSSSYEKSVLRGITKEYNIL